MLCEQRSAHLRELLRLAAAVARAGLCVPVGAVGAMPAGPAVQRRRQVLQQQAQQLWFGRPASHTLVSARRPHAEALNSGRMLTGRAGAPKVVALQQRLPQRHEAVLSRVRACGLLVVPGGHRHALVAARAQRRQQLGDSLSDAVCFRTRYCHDPAMQAYTLIHIS